MRPARIGHIGLAVRDLPRMLDFYQDVVGMRISDRMPYPEDSPFHECVWLRINSDHHVISMFGLRPQDRPPPSKEPAPGMHHLAFEMPSFEALQRAAREVRERDIPLQGMRTGGPGCQLRLYLWDPEDNMIELYWALDQIGWDGVARPYPPVESIDLESFDVDTWLEWKGAEFEGLRETIPERQAT